MHFERATNEISFHFSSSEERMEKILIRSFSAKFNFFKIYLKVFLTFLPWLYAKNCYLCNLDVFVFNSYVNSVLVQTEEDRNSVCVSSLDRCSTCQDDSRKDKLLDRNTTRINNRRLSRNNVRTGIHSFANVIEENSGAFNISILLQSRLYIIHGAIYQITNN